MVVSMAASAMVAGSTALPVSVGRASAVSVEEALAASAARVSADGQAPGPTARHVTLIGIEDTYGEDIHQAAGSVTLNAALAEALGVQQGDKVTLRLQRPSAVPRESLLGRKDASEVVEDWTLPVGRVLTAADAADHAG